MNILTILLIYTILVIIILVILRKCIPESLYVTIVPDDNHFLYNGRKWFRYRIGDVFYQPYYVAELDKYSELYPYSIATEYYSNNEKNIHGIKKIIDNRKLRKKDLLLHVRIGDIIEKFTEQWRSHYLKNDEWWGSLITFITENNITRIIMMGGCHIPECYEESWKYLESKKQFFESKGFEVTYRLGNSPDEDILFASNAKYYSTTGGGYGKLLGEIVESYGNIFFK